MNSQQTQQPAAVTTADDEPRCTCGPSCTCGPACACTATAKCAPACRCAD